MEIDDELGRQLHDRATRGQTLSAEEQEQLQAWYDKWDRIEMEQFGLTPEQEAAEEARLTELHAQIAAEEALLAEILTRNQTLVAQNEALRAEIRSLKERQAERAVTQPVG
jgi:hypothetical protein